MSAPLFYTPSLGQSGSFLELDSDNSRHAIQVLRLVQGSALSITDGKGNWADATVSIADRKNVRFSCKLYKLYHRPNVPSRLPSHYSKIEIDLSGS